MQRDALAQAIGERLPGWRFRLPIGGLALWCELPPLGRRGMALDVTTEAERRGVVVSPGPVFGVDGGFESFVRVPFTRPVPELLEAVDRLADAWAAVGSGTTRQDDRRSRVMVA
jgi:DNA-binding transcriptional MocR family regulator